MDQKNNTVPLQKILKSPKLDRAQFTGKKEFFVTCEDTQFISSPGIRDMMRWLKETSEVAPDMKIMFQSVPPTVYRQLLLVKRLLPKNLQISSLYVPFYCDSCSLDATKLVDAETIRRSTDLDSAIRPYLICESCKKEMEPDTQVPDFFSLVID